MGKDYRIDPKDFEDISDDMDVLYNGDGRAAQRENREKSRERKKAREKRKQVDKDIISQKLVGLCLIFAVAIICAIIRDWTIAVFGVPVGMILIFTKRPRSYREFMDDIRGGNDEESDTVK